MEENEEFIKLLEDTDPSLYCLVEIDSGCGYSEKGVVSGEYDGNDFTLDYTTYWKYGTIEYKLNVGEFLEILKQKAYTELTWEDFSDYYNMNQELYDGDMEYDNLEGIEWEQYINDGDEDDDENYDLDKFDYYDEFMSYLYENYDINDCDYEFDGVDTLTITILDEE